MSIYTVEGPDGRHYDIEGPAGASEAQIIAAVQQYISTQPKKESGVIAQLRQGTEQMLSSSQTAAEAMVNPEAAAKRGLERGQKLSDKYEDPLQWAKVEEAYKKNGLLSAAGELAGQVPQAIAQQAPNIATGLAGARLGTMAGIAVAPAFGPAAPFVPLVGGIIGAAAPSFVQQFGGNIERQAAEGEDISRGRAAATAVPQAALDVAGEAGLIGGKILGKVAGPEAAAAADKIYRNSIGKLFGKSEAELAKGATEATEKLAAEHLLTTIAKGTAKGAAWEVPPEVAQQALERWQAGLSLTSPDALDEYKQTAYQVALLGPVGAVGRFSEKLGADNEIADRKRAEATPAITPTATPGAPAAPAAATSTEGDLTVVGQSPATVQAPTETPAAPVAAATTTAPATGKTEPEYVTKNKEAAAKIITDMVGPDGLIPEKGTVGAIQKSLNVSSGVARKIYESLEGTVFSPKDPVTQRRTLLSAKPVEIKPVETITKAPVVDAEKLAAEKIAADKELANATQDIIGPTGQIQLLPAESPESGRSGTRDVLSVQEPTAKPPAAPVIEPAGVVRNQQPAEAANAGEGTRDAELISPPVEPKVGPVERPEDDRKKYQGAAMYRDMMDRLNGLIASNPENTALPSIKKKLIAKGKQGTKDYVRTRIDLAKQLQESEDAIKEVAASFAAFSPVSESRFQQQNWEANLRAQAIAQRERETQARATGKGETSKDLIDKVRAGNMNEVVQHLAEQAKGWVRDIAASDLGFSKTKVTPYGNAKIQRVFDAAKAKGHLTPELIAKTLKIPVEDAKATYHVLVRDKIIHLDGKGRLAFAPNRLSKLIAQLNIPPENEIIFRTVAAELKNLDWSNTIVQVEGNPDATDSQKIFDHMRLHNKLATYHPKTNTFFFRTAGLDEATVLHEMIHAGTVKILHLYKTNPDSLTPEQREAAEHINKIYEKSKSRLGQRFKLAHESVYEFVSYALTEKNFQQELAKIRVPSLAKYAKGLQDLWSQVTEALKNMYRLMTPAGLRVRQKISPNGQIIGGEKAPLGADTFRPGYEGNLALEVSEAFSRILSGPEAGIDVEELAATIEAPVEPQTMEGVLKDGAERLDKQIKEKPGFLDTVKNIWNHQGYDVTVKHTQDRWRILLVQQRNLDRNKQLVLEGPKVNNLYDRLTLWSQRSSMKVKEKLERHYIAMNQGLVKYTEATGLTVKEALNRIDKYLAAAHEPERRWIKYLRNVPLNNKVQIHSKLLNMTGTAAELRDHIFKEAHKNTNTWSEADGARYRSILEQLARPKDKGGFIDNTIDGFTRATVKPHGMPIDPNERVYDVLSAFEPQVLAQFREVYAKELSDGKTAASLKQIIDSMRALQAATIDLDIEANYWSQPVSNIKNLYGWKEYVPLKGRPDPLVSEGDDELEFHTVKSGGEVAPEGSNPFEGRFTPQDNILLQVRADAVRAAMRAGRNGITLAIKNLILAKHITAENPQDEIRAEASEALKENNIEKAKLLFKRLDEVRKSGPVKIDVIKFEDRFSPEFNINQYRGKNKIFHYSGDGNIEVFGVADKNFSEAIHGVVKHEMNSLFQIAMNGTTTATSWMGQQHTRFNFAFAVVNFVRDAFTNAYVIGADMGAKESANYIGGIVHAITKNGIGKAMRIANLYENANITEIRRIADKDPYVKDMLEWLEMGGRAAYVQSFSVKSQANSLMRELGRGKFLQSMDQVVKYFDIYNNTFEYASRVAAYSVAKKKFMAQGMSESQAKIKAASYSKNLMNFELVGESSKKAAGLYMFLRPSITCAVRTMDSLAPAFGNAEAAFSRVQESIRSQPGAKEAFLKDYAERKSNAKAMLWGTMASGAALYTTALAFAQDDDMGRNKVAVDDMQLWNRSIRLPLGAAFTNKENEFLQIPWGFGFGAFASFGAQTMALLSKNQSLPDYLSNTANIAADSFLPLPFARFSVAEHPVQWVLDSLAPTPAKPFLEYAWNLDGLGREIHRERQNRFGEAYSGTTAVPEIYVRAARMFDKIANEHGWSVPGHLLEPTVLNFWGSSYADALSTDFQWATDLGMSMAGKKEFDVKKDLAPFNRFFGKKSSIDAREFADVERQILAMNSKLKQYENHPEQLEIYRKRNPNAEFITHAYFKSVDGQLKDIRRQIGETQASDLPFDQRTKQIRELKKMRDWYMRSFIDTVKQLGMEP